MQMQFIESIEEGSGLQEGCVVSIGNFDGVHRGHQRILKRGREIADERGEALAVLTFEPHPMSVLHPDRAPGLLTGLVLKQELLCGFGVDYFLVLKSSVEILSLSSEEFVERFLVEGLRPSVLVEGRDFNFGSGRSGSIETLEGLGGKRGFEVAVVEAEEVELEGGRRVRVSSSLVREMVTGGRVVDVKSMLGREYRLAGRIVAGRGKGRELGFPTLNMERCVQLLPAEGVYAGFVQVGDSEGKVCRRGERRPAVFSIGMARTLDDSGDMLIEAHLLSGWSESFKGKWMGMDFVRLIRGQERFGSEEELAEQIGRDCEEAKKILAWGHG